MNARDALVPSTATQEELNAKLALTTKPKITPEDLEKAIVGETYHVFPGSCLTVCVLTLFNGFTVTGESACADPGNFKADIGQTIARRNAKDKIWSLLGFQLKTKLDMIEKAGPPTGRIAGGPGEPTSVATYVGTKVVHAVPMNRQLYNDLRGWAVPLDEFPGDEGYLVQYTDGGESNVEGFTGYISWSPRDVFEKAYGAGVVPNQEKALTRAERLDKEYSELIAKIERLAVFLGSEMFKTLGTQEQGDLVAQHHHMSEYRWYLGRRRDRALSE